MRTLIPVLGLLVAASTLSACGGETPEPVTPDQVAGEQPAASVTPAQQQAIDGAEQETGATGLGIEDAILKLCPDVRPPKFGTASARVKDEFRNTLVALARCMNEGQLQGRELLLVGHADPRGEDDYNLALGGRRADSVRRALGSLGVSEGRLDVSSRGEMEARGTTEETWSQDRRVDIKLKNN